MSKKEKHYKPQFKAKASLAALQIEETSTKRPVAPNLHLMMVFACKWVLHNSAAELLDKNHGYRKHFERKFNELCRHLSLMQILGVSRSMRLLPISPEDLVMNLVVKTPFYSQVEFKPIHSPQANGNNT